MHGCFALTNCTKIVMKSQLVYMCDFEVAPLISMTKIALSSATKIACVNGPLCIVYLQVKKMLKYEML